MRMRKKKHGAERLEACGDVIVRCSDDIRRKPVYLEIGCGKGKFTVENARRHPDKNFVAIEKISDVAVIAAEKIKNPENNVSNVQLIVGDVKCLNDYFCAGDVERIYINFPDPWSKKGYFKRRLTHKSFLELYKSVLVPGGEIFFKTDNADLFEYSLEQFTENGFGIRSVTRNLHESEYAKENITTEYETNFSEKGFKINRCEAYLLT